jgi:ABC-type polysaccharide/polyol phosphate export permease
MEYADEGFHEPRRTDWALAFWVVSGLFSFLLWVSLIVQLSVYVPRSEKMFDDFKMKLPHATVVTIHHAWWIVPALIVATLAVCLIARSRWCWLVLLLALPLALNVFVFLSMFLPQQMLLEALGR